MGIGITEMIIISMIILLVFGAKRLPEVARSMGTAVNEFKRAKDEIINSPPHAPTPAAKTIDVKHEVVDDNNRLTND